MNEPDVAHDLPDDVVADHELAARHRRRGEGEQRAAAHRRDAARGAQRAEARGAAVSYTHLTLPTKA